MKKQFMLFAAALSFVSVPYSYTQSAPAHMTRNEKRQRMLTSYMSSLALSGGVGVITGGILRYLEQKVTMQEGPLKLFMMLLGWAIESELRNDIIVALQRDLDQYGIDQKKALMFKGAWIASWLSYLQA
jgi:hypothetical protein